MNISMPHISHYISIPPLREWGFARMLFVAMAAHGMLLLAFSLWPRTMVEHMPVRVLSFQLGDGMFITPEIEKPKAQEDVAYSAPAPKPSPKAVAPKPAAKAPPETRQVVRQQPAENRFINPEENFAARIQGTPTPRYAPAEQPAEAIDRQALLQQSPAQYVRQYGLPSIDSVLATPEREVEATIRELTSLEHDALPAGASEIGSPANAVLNPEIIRQRYEAQISGWIAQHKLYPPSAAGKEGRAVVRIRIDRLGYVRFYKLEQSSGVKALDNAAIDMVKRANPLPKPPANYPVDDLIEFLIPIRFDAPL